MSDWEDRIEYLAERQMRGELDASDLAELERLCRDPQAARAFVEALADHQEWREWAGRSASAASFVQAVLDRRGAGRDADAFLQAVKEKARRKSSPRHRRVRPGADTRYLLPALMAAGVIVAVALAAVMGGGDAPAPRPKLEESRVPEPVEPPPAPPVEKPPEAPKPAPVPELPRENPPAPPAPKVVPPAVVREPAPLPPPPAPPKETPAPSRPSPSTVTVKEPEPAPVLATIERAQGTVHVGDRPGREIRAGDVVRTIGPESVAVVKYPDGTRLEVAAETAVGPFGERAGGGKSLALEHGVLVADVARQPAPLILATPHAEVTVLGTEFTLAATAAWTRLEVREGRVRLARTGGGAAEVRAGTYAVAAPGVDPVARLLYRVPASGLRLWLRADGGVSLSGTAVSQWNDQSGNNLHAAQGAGASQPAYLTNVTNGRPAIRFDGSDDALALPSGFNDFRAGVTAFVVARPAKVVPWARFIDLGNGTQQNNIVFGQKDSPLLVTYWVYAPDQTRGKVDAPNALALDRFHSFSVVETGAGSATIYRNGLAVGTGQTSVPRNVLRTANAIGASGGASNDPHFRGEIAEILLYNRALSDAERLLVEDYLNTKYFNALGKPGLK